MSRCYDFKFKDQGTNCDNYIKVIRPERRQCTIAMDPLVAEVLLLYSILLCMQVHTDS